jgi:hypothetical protein
MWVHYSLGIGRKQMGSGFQVDVMKGELEKDL